MALIRDYILVDIEAGGSKVFNVVGRTIAVRREQDAGKVRVVGYSNSGQLVSDNTLQAGEKIETLERFHRLEVYNLEQDGRDVHITAGDGDFNSDIVEGNVTVNTDPTNPITVVSQQMRTYFADITATGSGIELPLDSIHNVRTVTVQNDANLVCYINTKVGSTGSIKLDVGGTAQFSAASDETIVFNTSASTGTFRLMIEYYG